MNRPERPLLLVGAVIMLVVMSCSVFSGIPATPTPETAVQVATPTPETAMQVVTAAPGDTAPAPTVTSSTAIAASGTIDPSQGLDALPSYRETINLSVAGKDASGNDVPGTLRVQQDKFNTDKSTHLNVTLSGSLASQAAGSGLMDFYTLSDISYLVIAAGGGQTTCISLPTGQSPLQGTLITIKEIIGKIHDAKLVKKGEVINGVMTDHYQFDQSNLTGSAVTNARGDVWVAQDGQYVLKVNGTAVGASLLTFNDPNAKINYDYLIDQVGKVAKIELPKSCGVLPVDIPITPSTRLQMSVSGFY